MAVPGAVEWLKEARQFVEGIGLGVREAPVLGAFLPGVSLAEGGLLLDPERVLYAGDLLHEAGHLAVLAPAERLGHTGKLEPDAGLEMAAIAWSWAALRQLRMPAEIVFHAQGYRGGSAAIIEAFSSGTGFGVPLLEWMGMTLTGERATAAGVPPFPHMLRWLRPDPGDVPRG